jgi:hypothetical protein
VAKPAPVPSPSPEPVKEEEPAAEEPAAEEEAAPAEEEAAPAEEEAAAAEEEETPAPAKNATKTASRRMLRSLPLPGAVVDAPARRALLQLKDGQLLGDAATLNNTIRINGVPVTRANVQAGKSQVYVIDEVLVPPTMKEEIGDALAKPAEEEAASSDDKPAAAASSAASVAVSALLAVPALFALLF